MGKQRILRMKLMVTFPFFLLLLWTAVSDAKKPFRISVVQNKPWIMLKEDSSNRVGNDRYEGFFVDMLDKLAAMFNVNFELQEQADGRYGGRDESGNWNGMIGSVISETADLAVGDITITSGREQAVDFSVPFLQTGITILYSANSWKSKSVNSIEDLVNQSVVKFGAVRGGSTENFFKNSPNPVYRKAWEQMTSEGIMTESNAEGIAMKLGAKMRKDINIGLLKLMEDGSISQIKNKWWKKNSKCNQVMEFLSSFADLF